MYLCPQPCQGNKTSTSTRIFCNRLRFGVVGVFHVLRDGLQIRVAGYGDDSERSPAPGSGNLMTQVTSNHPTKLTWSFSARHVGVRPVHQLEYMVAPLHDRWRLGAFIVRGTPNLVLLLSAAQSAWRIGCPHHIHISACPVRRDFNSVHSWSAANSNRCIHCPQSIQP